MAGATDDNAVLQTILNAAVDAIVVSDDKGIILRANPAACRLFQYEEAELLGQNVSILMPDPPAGLHDSFLARHIKTGENRIIGIGREVEGQSKDKSLIPLQLSVGETTVDGHRMFVGIMHNLTQHKAIEAALARSQRLDAIGQMTGGIAHDFNNLLTVVIGNLELLQMRGADDNQKAMISDALDAAELGADLTARLMVFARKSNLKSIETDLAQVCDDTLAMLKRTLGASYRITTEYEPDLSPVIVDPAQLQSALVNLALNARDAMQDGGELLISVANVTIDDTYLAQEIDMKPGDYVRLAISDDGDGMGEEAQKRAFEPFFTTKSDMGGTGLGLAMVYGFVRQSGGHITLYSEPGLGTSFGLYFPAVKLSDEAPMEEAQTSGRAQSPAGTGKTVLIVEDNAKVRGLTIERIRDLGFNVEVAVSGDEAYRMLKAGLQVELVFSDLIMPGDLNGYDLAARIAREFPHIKILLTSGYASDVVTASMPHDRHYDILHKPYRQSDLSKRLQALLAGDADG